MECKFKKKCKRADSDLCSPECFPYVVLHGTEGNRGYWATTRVPKKYSDCTKENLPIQKENPEAYKVIKMYADNPLYYVLEKGMGLFLFSIPNAENRLGTGTGKTTSAITILNEFLLSRVEDYIKNDFTFRDNPTMFIKLSELQNAYNGMFRGSFDVQKSATNKYFNFVDRMKKVELLVVDDIGIRDLSETFKNELYEIIDHRVTEDLPTIYTSNYPMSKMPELLGERIASRIEGQCYPVGFKGADNRKGGLFR